MAKQASQTIISSKDTRHIYQWLALLSAAIWGAGFAFQKSAMEVLTPFAFSSLRMATGGVVILALILCIERAGLKQVTQTDNGSILPLPQ